MTSIKGINEGLSCILNVEGVMYKTDLEVDGKYYK